MTFQQFAYRNVIRNSRVYAAFFMASIFSVMVFFIYSMLMFHPSIEDQFLRDITFGGMIVAEIILVIFTLFFLFYSMSAFLQSRSKEFGLLLYLGMEKRQLNQLIFIETLILGFISITVGIFLGFSFSKFFFMVIREMFLLDSLPLYLSWKPFALTIFVFLSLFIIISISSMFYIRKKEIIQLLKGYLNSKDEVDFTKWKAILGLGLLFSAYSLVVFSTTIHMNILLTILIILLVIIGTYYFFTDSILYILSVIRKRKKLYWNSSRLVAFAEASIKIRENAKMFFVVTIVSTVAFLSVGVVTSFTTFTGEYRVANPVSIFYSSDWDNPFEEQHLMLITEQLQQENLSFEMVRFNVKKQTSSSSKEVVNLIRESAVNSLAVSLKYPIIDLKSGEALSLTEKNGYSVNENKQGMQTVLEESSVPIYIKGVYNKTLFPEFPINNPVIILSDEDYYLVNEPLMGYGRDESTITYYAFHVPEWLRTKDIGTELDFVMTNSTGTTNVNPNPFYFENPGLNYSVIQATFSLLLFTGLLVAAVLLLAAGSFVYFKLYTDLERDKKQYDVLRRMGVTDQELLKIVNRQLIPQFFLPWGLAMVHSSFSFIFLQSLWVDLAAISIAMEMLLVLLAFSIIQISYFYLIRWRYMSHIQA